MSHTHFIVQPGGTMQGECLVPGDKSISHRAIIFGALAEGVTLISGFLEGLDCLKTRDAFQSMGVQIEALGPGELRIQGVGLNGLKQPSHCLDLGNSGTSMRLLTGLLAAQSFDSEVTGDGSLIKRPMDRVIEPLIQMGAKIESHEGKAPLKIYGQRQLKGVHYQSPFASAQVKSCLLLAGLYAEGETSITEPGVSRDHTERMLSAFSYPIKKTAHTVSLHGGGTLKAERIMIPGDLSSAAFLMVGAAITKGSQLLIKNVGINPTRLGVIYILKAMGADIRLMKKRLYGDEQVADIQIKYAPLIGIDIPQEWVSLAIDEFPAIFIAASAATGKTVLKGAKELKVKESDRIQAMVKGLRTVGINAISLEDGAIIHPGEIQGGEVNSYGDHRIAMAFAMAGLRAQQPITISDVDNVATSFPGFLTLTKQLGLDILSTS
jgi:3-phosphoshikimate 1-carboxyvinyltransferase